MSDSSKQYDVQDVEAWLSSEHHMHGATGAIGPEAGILDVCPSKEYVHKKIEELSDDKFRRPIMMPALDGAHGPMRPEPSPHSRKGKRGGGEWKEIKGFRRYFLNGQNIEHLATQGLNDQGPGGISKMPITYSKSDARNITGLTIKL